MNVLISPDTYIHYFATLTKPNKTDIDNDINALINNKNNNHILSRSLIDLLEKNYSKEIVDQLIGPYINGILDERSINIKGEVSNNFDVILDSMVENNSNLDNPHHIAASISMDEIKTSSKVNLIVVPSLSKPSFSWLQFQLACYNPRQVTLRHSDFREDTQIQEVFDSIIQMMNSNVQPSIFDRQYNLDHTLFDRLKKTTIHYFTSWGRNYTESNEKFHVITSNFNKARVYMASQHLIHERKLIIGNYIIEADDDFWNLEVTRLTWKIDFTYCSITVDELLAVKRRNFRRYNPK